MRRRHLIVAGATLTSGCLRLTETDESNPASETETEIATEGAVTERPVGAAPDPEGWLMQGYDTARTGHAPDKRGPTAQAGIEAVWRSNVSGPNITPPVVAGDTVLVSVLNDGVYAMDAETGDQQWKVETDPKSSPVVSGTTAYVGIADSGAAKISTFDLSTGEEYWSFDFDVDTDTPNTLQPLIDDERVYVGDKTLYALDVATGDEQWQFETDDQSGMSLALQDGTLYAASGELYALDPGTGEMLWKRRERGLSSPAVAGGTVYYGTGSRVRAIGTASGETKWTFEPTDPPRFIGSPAVDGERVYVGSGSYEVDGPPAVLYAIDAATGERRWSSREAGQGNVGLSPAVDGRNVYIGYADYDTDETELLALDPSDGTERWGFEPITYPGFAIADGSVFMSSSAVFRLSDGQ